jgi:hypothetical protein
MSRPLEEIIFQTRVLAQGHPFSGPGDAYLNQIVARERTEQSVPEIGVWAGYAITAGYCLRRFEEEDTGHGPDAAPASESSDVGTPSSVEELDELSTEIADRIRSENPGDLFLYTEDAVVDALDHLIAGEVERRLSHWAETVDEETFAELEAYVAWWTVKGYALRVAERLVTARRAP